MKGAQGLSEVRARLLSPKHALPHTRTGVETHTRAGVEMHAQVQTREQLHWTQRTEPCWSRSSQMPSMTGLFPRVGEGLWRFSSVCLQTQSGLVPSQV